MLYNAAIRYLGTRSIFRKKGGISMFRKSSNTMEAAIRDAHSDFTDAYQMYIMHWR